jgi:hypothetical protein
LEGATEMNANELADELETNINSGLRFTAATMLRQQQAQIEALKEQCVLLQEGYNAQAILLGVETGLTPDFFFMENDLMGKR